MIINDFKKLEKFCHLDKPYLEAILDFASKCSKDTANGSYPIKDKVLFANVNSYNTVPGKTDEFETHQTYVDLHILLSGEEQIYLSEISHLQLSKPYDIDKDFALWTGADQTSILLSPGKAALFFPQDAHQVGRSISEYITQNKKIVFKIACDLFR